MDGMRMFEIFLLHLPTILSVLAALGLWRLGAELIRKFTKEQREAAAKTPSKLDDKVVGAVADGLDAVAAFLDRGNVKEAMDAVDETRKVVVELLRGGSVPLKPEQLRAKPR